LLLKPSLHGSAQERNRPKSALHIRFRRLRYAPRWSRPRALLLVPLRPIGPAGLADWKTSAKAAQSWKYRCQWGMSIHLHKILCWLRELPIFRAPACTLPGKPAQFTVDFAPGPRESRILRTSATRPA